ncbi:hypothetical protein EUTSA_v10002867mg, partial [Eutrema salsugineum]
SDSWRVLDVVAPECYIESSNGVSLKGNIYWVAYDKPGHSEEFILSFEFTGESFRRFCLPAFQNPGQVALSGIKMDIWVTNEIDTEANSLQWSKFFTVDIALRGYSCHVPPSFLMDEEKKVVVCCYASSNKTIIDQYYTEYPFVEATQVSSVSSIIFSYVPSLVQIQQVEAKNIRKY